MKTHPKPPKNWRMIVSKFDEETAYHFWERIGILCGTTEPPPDSAVLIALEQVRTKP